MTRDLQVGSGNNAGKPHPFALPLRQHTLFHFHHAQEFRKIRQSPRPQSPLHSASQRALRSPSGLLRNILPCELICIDTIRFFVSLKANFGNVRPKGAGATAKPLHSASQRALRSPSGLLRNILPCELICIDTIRFFVSLKANFGNVRPKGAGATAKPLHSASQRALRSPSGLLRSILPCELICIDTIRFFHSKPPLEMCVRRVQGRPESPCKKLHDKPTMEMCTVKGFVKPDEVRDCKAPKSLLRHLNKSPKI